jgi:hypothetical protein
MDIVLFFILLKRKYKKLIGSKNKLKFFQNTFETQKQIGS